MKADDALCFFKKAETRFPDEGKEEELSVSTILLLPLGSLKQQTF
jgi:hypothetical protein